MKRLSEFKMVVFDMAGTTVDEGGLVYQTMKSTIEHHGYPVNDKQIKAIGGMNKMEAISQILAQAGEQEPAVLQKIYQDFEQILTQNYERANLKEMEGASKVFKQLKYAGLWVVINTGYSRDIKNKIIEKLGWHGLIDKTISAGEVESGRPQPDMIKYFQKTFQVEDPALIIKVGDTINDILEGKNANCGLVIGVSYGAGNPQDLLDNGADLIIDDLYELLKLL